MTVLRRPARLAALAAALTLGGAGAALAAVQSGAPDQAFQDSSSAGSTATGGSGLWGDMPGGVASRPFISALSVTTGGVTTSLITDGAASAPAVQPGDLTAVVAPFNLCRPGQAPGGECYATPNRVGIAVGYAEAGGGITTDLSAPRVAPRQAVDATTVIDMTVNLNTLGRTLRWSWLNGDLVSWRATALGTDAAQVRVRLRPVATPAFDYEALPPNGCTATPVRDCDLERSQGEQLAANLVLSLDDTLPTALTGAVFATRGAMSGYLEPGGSAAAPTLDLQIASAHLTAAGTPQVGAITALIPSSALLAMYGMLPEDAARLFTARRTGSPGTQSAPRFRRASAATDGTDGLLVDIDGITFSVPTYRIGRRKLEAPRTSVTRRRGTVTVSGAVRACRAQACRVTVRRILPGLSGRTALVGRGGATAGRFAVRARATRLKAGSGYVVSVHTIGRRPRVVATAAGRA